MEADRHRSAGFGSWLAPEKWLAPIGDPKDCPTDTPIPPVREPPLPIETANGAIHENDYQMPGSQRWKLTGTNRQALENGWHQSAPEKWLAPIGAPGNSAAAK